MGIPSCEIDKDNFIDSLGGGGANQNGNKVESKVLKQSNIALQLPLSPWFRRNHGFVKPGLHYIVHHHLDLPKSSWRKERDDLSRSVNSWITQLDGRTVFGTADGTFDHNV